MCHQEALLHQNQIFVRNFILLKSPDGREMSQITYNINNIGELFWKSEKWIKKREAPQLASQVVNFSTSCEQVTFHVVGDGAPEDLGDPPLDWLGWTLRWNRQSAPKMET